MNGKSVVMFSIDCGDGWIFDIGKKVALYFVFLKIAVYVSCITTLAFFVFALSTFGLYDNEKGWILSFRDCDGGDDDDGGGGGGSLFRFLLPFVCLLVLEFLTTPRPPLPP